MLFVTKLHFFTKIKTLNIATFKTNQDIFALVKIFDVGSEKTFGNTESEEQITSEFDEIW